MGRLVIDGEEVYELDENCLREKMEKEKRDYMLRNRNLQMETMQEEKIKETENNSVLHTLSSPFSHNS